MVKKYVKRPIPIEAVQYTGENWGEIVSFAGGLASVPKTGEGFLIKTLEGEHLGHVGDYVLKGIEGEFYICAKRIFEKSYEETCR